jgi:hypothetical protein
MAATSFAGSASPFTRTLVVGGGALFALAAAAGKLRVGPARIAEALAIVFLAALAARRPVAATAIGLATVCCVPIYWASPVAGLPVVPTAAVVVTLVLAPAALAAAQRVRLHAADVAFIAFVALLLASNLLTLGLHYRPLIGILVTVAGPYAVLRCLATDRRIRLSAAVGISAAAVVLAAVAIGERITGDNVFFHLVTPRYLASLWAHPELRFGATRAEASFGQPIAFGMFCGVAVVVALGLSRRSSRPLPALLASGAAMVGLLLSLSRGPLIAAALGVVLWLLARRRSLTRRDFALVALVLAAMVAVPAARSTIANLGSSTFSDTAEAESATYRLGLLQLAQKPEQFSVLGHSRTDVTGLPSDAVSERIAAGSIDSQYVLIYLRYGVLTLLAFLLVGLLQFRMLGRAGDDPLDLAWVASGALLMIGLLSVALITQAETLTYLVLGVSAAAAQRRESSADS